LQNFLIAPRTQNNNFSLLLKAEQPSLPTSVTQHLLQGLYSVDAADDVIVSEMISTQTSSWCARRWMTEWWWSSRCVRWHQTRPLSPCPAKTIPTHRVRHPGTFPKKPVGSFGYTHLKTHTTTLT